MKRKFTIALVGILLLGGLCSIAYYFKQPSFLFNNDKPAQLVTKVSQDISYHGETGKTALELLQDNFTTIISGSGEMSFVTSINGRAADSTKNEFWEMLINGKSASVGAGSYQTKASDIISWRISKF